MSLPSTVTHVFAPCRTPAATSSLCVPLFCQECPGNFFVFGGYVRFTRGLGNDDGATDEGNQGLSEPFDIPGANLFEEAGDESFQVGKVTVDERADFGFVTLGTKLSECFRKSAAMEVRAFGSRLQGVEDRKEPFEGGLGLVAREGMEQFLPAFVLVSEVLGDQFALGGEVPVEGHLRHAAFGDDAVYPDRIDAMPIE